MKTWMLPPQDKRVYDITRAGACNPLQPVTVIAGTIQTNVLFRSGDETGGTFETS